MTASGFTPRVSVRSFCTNTTTLACDQFPVGQTATTTTSQVGAGTYFVWVDSSSSTASGSYSLSITASGAGGGGAGGGFGGGGGTGGGFGGGGSVGGGLAGDYVKTSITASCDTLSAPTVHTAAISDDAATTQMTLPISFTFYGQTMTSYTVSSNGIMQVWNLTGSGVTTGSNGALTSIENPIAPFWDDLDNVTTTSLSSQVLGSGSTRRLVVEWTDWAFYTTGGTPTSDRLRFQAKLFESSGIIEFHYCSLVGTSAQLSGTSAGIGISDGSLLSTAHTTGVSTGTGLRFTP